jgi:hypothetical protein
MRDRNLVLMGSFAAGVVIACMASVPVAGQTPSVSAQPASAAQTFSVPRTPWGHPDLQGIWNNSTITRLERPKEFETKEFLTEQEAAAYEERIAKTRVDGPPPPGNPGTYNQHWFDRGTKVVPSRRTAFIVDPPDGKLPALTPQEQQKAEAAAKARPPLPLSHEDIDVGERCITDGLPLFPFVYNNNYQIVQTPDHVAILHEMYQEMRIIPLDGRPHIDASIGQWFGDSRGHWEGNTLVVDTTNFADKSNQLWGARWRASRPTLHLVERFTRVDANTFNYQFTMEDPAMFVKPFTAVIPFSMNAGSLGATEGQVYEYACHEGNYSIVNILNGARAQERAAAEEAARNR